MTASAAAAVAPPVLDPVGSAKAAGLRYTTDTRPGIRRHRRGRGFAYIDADGRAIRSRPELARIAALVIPPAWTDVWICPDPRGHLQATGRDARGRKQYRYHPQWREVRDETKYDRHDRLRAGAAGDPPARRTRDLRAGPAAREGARGRRAAAREDADPRRQRRVRASEPIVRPDDAARRARRVSRARTVRFAFRGKSGVEHDIDLNDRRLARIVRQCRDLPGYELFQYLDENGERQTIGSADVNAYLQDDHRARISPSKDFRTWAGTVLAAQLLREFEAFTSDGAGEEEHRRARSSGGEAARQHQGGLPQVLHPPGDIRRVPRRLDARDDRAAGAEGLACGRSADGDGALGALAAAPPRCLQRDGGAPKSPPREVNAAVRAALEAEQGLSMLGFAIRLA